MILNWLLILWTAFFSSVNNDERPAFKGGKKGIESFISENLIYPAYSRQNCIQGTIQVGFKLNGAGRVIDAKVQKGFGIDLDEEALRIVRLSSGKWMVPEGFDTSNVMVLPVTFALQGYNCDSRPAKEIQEAINAYRAQEELTGAITNFYERRQPGKYTARDEQKIIQLKEQLGYDEDFIDNVIAQAKKKLKQGDKEGACDDLQFVKKIGSDKADELISKYCN